MAKLQPMIAASQADELMVITAVYDHDARKKSYQPAGGCFRARQESSGVSDRKIQNSRDFPPVVAPAAICEKTNFPATVPPSPSRSSPMPAYRSRTSTHGRNMAGARGLWRATGMKDGDFGKPIIAIANSASRSSCPATSI